jgi:hypothetical protein
MNSLLLILICVVLMIQAAVIGVLLRKRRVTHVPTAVPNYELIRLRLQEQLSEIGWPALSVKVISARFALEGLREGNSKKVQGSGIRDLQDAVLRKIREHGADLKLQTASSLMASYCGDLIESLRNEMKAVESGTLTLSRRADLLAADLAAARDAVEKHTGTLRTFFHERIPNAVSFADHCRRSQTDGPMNRQFSDIVMRQSEFKSMTGECVDEIRCRLTELRDRWNTEMELGLPEPDIHTSLFGSVELRVREIAGGSDDVLADSETVTREFRDLGNRCADAYSSAVQACCEVYRTAVNETISRSLLDSHRQQIRLKESLKKFEHLIRRINADT